MKLLNIIYMIAIFTTCKAQTEYKLVGGPCEGCEAVFEYGDSELSSIDVLPGYEQSNNKLVISGTVYGLDGKTPAPNVIMYFYQTDENGIYVKRGDEKDWAIRHGYIRGWIKTDVEGKYKIYTIKPGTYPSRTEPAHIHLTILEPSGKYYYADSYHFAGDSLLTDKFLKNEERRAGSGVIELRRKENILYGERDIILGKNIPSYD